MNSKNKCTGCKKFFSSQEMLVSNLGKFCAEECRMDWAYNNTQKLVELSRNKVEKKRKAKRSLEKEAIKSRREHLADLQKVFNEYIRLRDHRDPCISCQRHHEGQYHAGHYLSVGAHPELRFNEDNCHKQCAPCNNHLSGNIAKYRINLIEKIGIGKVEALEGNNSVLKLSVVEIKEKKAHYKKLVKELKLREKYE